MERSPKSASKHERRIAIYVFKLGGVAGVTRRFVYRQSGPFTTMQILGTIITRYPGLEPGPNQLEAIMEHMERRQVVKCIDCDGHGKLFLRVPRWRQLTLKL
jgi:hypothetical protein